MGFSISDEQRKGWRFDKEEECFVLPFEKGVVRNPSRVSMECLRCDQALYFGRTGSPLSSLWRADVKNLYSAFSAFLLSSTGILGILSCVRALQEPASDLGKRNSGLLGSTVGDARVCTGAEVSGHSRGEHLQVKPAEETPLSGTDWLREASGPHKALDAMGKGCCLAFCMQKCVSLVPGVTLDLIEKKNRHGHFAILARLVLNTWPQAILPPPLLKVPGLQFPLEEGGLHCLFSSIEYQEPKPCPRLHLHVESRLHGRL
ncbi:hypothetical protein AAY473_035865, partial [Plecturocebus cupreus]